MGSGLELSRPRDQSWRGHFPSMDVFRSCEPSRSKMGWRRERDSNPRYGFPYSSFQDWPFNHSAISPTTTVLLQSGAFLKGRRAVYLPGFNWLTRALFHRARSSRWTALAAATGFQSSSRSWSKPSSGPSSNPRFHPSIPSMSGRDCAPLCASRAPGSFPWAFPFFWRAISCILGNEVSADENSFLRTGVELFAWRSFP